MEKFKPSATDFVGNIKKQIENFIKNSEVLDKETKDKLTQELGNNWYDARFDGEIFIEDAIKWAQYKWQQQNFEQMQLWKQIVIANASVSNDPQDVADKVVDAYRKEWDV